jgi:hypothetical protein
MPKMIAVALMAAVSASASDRIGPRYEVSPSLDGKLQPAILLEWTVGTPCRTAVPDERGLPAWKKRTKEECSAMRAALDAAKADIERRKRAGLGVDAFQRVIGPHVRIARFKGGSFDLGVVFDAVGACDEKGKCREPDVAPADVAAKAIVDLARKP